VVAVGDDVENVREGDRIAIRFKFACGSCTLCRNGRENVCENHVGLGFMNEAPGAFAEEVHIPNADINAVPLPDAIGTDTAAGIGCRSMTSYHAMAHQATSATARTSSSTASGGSASPRSTSPTRWGRTSSAWT
jgi:alcohol dehydrogenase